MQVLELVPLSSASSVVDLGAGRCELLIRLVERYGCQAEGVDADETFLTIGRREAAARLPGGSLRLVHQDAASFLKVDPDRRFDMALCIGASQAFGDYRTTLALLKVCVRPGGWLLVGETYWKQKPDKAYLQFLGAADEAEMSTHQGNIAIAEEAGLIPLWASTANDDDWDAYEWRYRMNVEQFAAQHPQDADHDAMLERIRSWNHGYLTWGRATLGFGLHLFRNG